MAVTLPEVFSFAASALFCVWYFMQKHWLANNALGLSFSIQGIEHISIGKLSTGEQAQQAARLGSWCCVLEMMACCGWLRARTGDVA